MAAQQETAGRQPGLQIIGGDRRFEEDEVGGRLPVAQPEPVELGADPARFLANDIDDAPNMRLVLERRDASRQRQLVLVKAAMQAADDIGDFGPGDAITQAQTRQAVSFGEAARDDDIAPIQHKAQGIGIIGIVDEMMIDGVHDQHDMLGQAVHQPPHGNSRDDGAGGVVGVAEHDQPGSLADGVQHSLGAVAEALGLKGYIDYLRAQGQGNFFVGAGEGGR